MGCVYNWRCVQHIARFDIVAIAILDFSIYFVWLIVWSGCLNVLHVHSSGKKLEKFVPY